MTDTCETDKAHGHSPDDPQCISYSQFVAVLAAGNETELKRLCQLLHDPGPYFERCLYELIMTKLQGLVGRQFSLSILQMRWGKKIMIW